MPSSSSSSSCNPQYVHQTHHTPHIHIVTVPTSESAAAIFVSRVQHLNGIAHTRVDIIISRFPFIFHRIRRCLFHAHQINSRMCSCASESRAHLWMCNAFDPNCVNVYVSCPCSPVATESYRARARACLCVRCRST